MRVLNIKKYLTQECEWTPAINNSEYGLVYSSVSYTLRCFKYDNGASTGKSSYDIKPNQIIMRSTSAYIISNPDVKNGDRLDGMIINSCDALTDRNGNYLYSICGVT